MFFAFNKDLCLSMWTNFDGCFLVLIPTAISPIPWKVFLLSLIPYIVINVATNTLGKFIIKKIFYLLLFTCNYWMLITGNLFITYENPRWDCSLINDLAVNRLSSSTPRLKNSGGMKDLGLKTLMISCPIDACLTSFGARARIKEQRFGGGYHHSSWYRTSMVSNQMQIELFWCRFWSILLLLGWFFHFLIASGFLSLKDFAMI